MSVMRIGIDLGGTKIEGVLLDENLRDVDRIRIPTNREEGYDAILNRIVDLIRKLQKQAYKNETLVGICTPGAISPASGRIKNSNTACLIDQPLREDLEAELNQEIAMDNDANCFAIAEAMLGAGREYATVFGVIMGTGVGGGIVMDGTVHRGPMLIAGEWGHHSIDINGRHCWCGKQGCLETYISGPALERHWTTCTGDKATLKTTMGNWTENQHLPGAVEWKNDFLRWFALGLSNVLNILDPDCVVLGGGVSNIPFLYDAGVEIVKNFMFTDQFTTPILPNKLGDSAGVYGAALLPER